MWLIRKKVGRSAWGRGTCEEEDVRSHSGIRGSLEFKPSFSVKGMSLMGKVENLVGVLLSLFIAHKVEGYFSKPLQTDN